MSTFLQRLQKSLDDGAAAELSGDVLKDLAVASIIGATVLAFSAADSPSEHALAKAVALVILSVVFFILSIALKGGAK